MPKHRTGMDAEMFDLETFVCPPEDAVDALPLFAEMPVDVVTPRIETPAPSAPGSESSRRGATIIDPFRSGIYRKIMLALGASSHPMSREQLSERIDVKESTLCGRLSELRPLWVAVVPDAQRSSAGVLVDGYALTEQGRARLVEAA